MTYDFAPRIERVKPSDIRELLKYSSQSNVIPFSAGNPSFDTFPLDDIQEICTQILQNEPEQVLQYGITEGLPELRDAVKQDLTTRYGVGSTNDDLIIMTGAQQCLDLASKAFCRPGDVVLCENPSFVGALNAFKANDAKLVGIDLEPDGVNLEQLEAAMKQHPTARLLYTIPNFQNPTGISMSLQKRKAVYQLAKHYRVVILEDNPYGDLRFRGSPIAPIKSLDTDGIVIYCGSFSKIISPGLRIGFVCAPSEIVQKITVLKQCNDVHTNLLSQKIAYHFLQQGSLQSHLERIQAIYRRKATIMLSSMEKEFPSYVKWTQPDGGLFVWCTLPKEIDVREFCTQAVNRYKVSAVPGHTFLTSESLPCHSIRLNYSAPTDEQIQKGIHILGNFIANSCKKGDYK